MTGSVLTHIIWDWNGTLLDDLELCHELTVEQARAFGVAPFTVLDYRDLFTHPVTLFYHRLGFHIPPHDFQNFSKQYHSEYEKRRGELSLQPGALESLRRFKELGFRQVILSAHEQSILDSSITLFGIRKYLDCAWGMHETIGHSKLDNGRALLAELGASPKQVLLIGDTDHDAEVADRLGLHCALVDRGFQSRTVLERTGKPVFSSLFALHPWFESQFPTPVVQLSHP